MSIPRHIAIIMDGNGRWAQSRGLPRGAGHRAGVKAVRSTIEACVRHGVPMLTLFAFSSENWRRPKEEVGLLMGLFLEALDREVDELHKNGVRLRFIGELALLAPELVLRMRAAEQRTMANTRLTVNIAVAYGGRWDIVRAATGLAADVAAGKLPAESIDESAFAARLLLGDSPDPDLFIRTGGEHRISNFLLWNLAYTELCFLPELWPEFSPEHFEQALAQFAQRERRFGMTSSQVAKL